MHLKMKDLIAQTGLSRQTIHFYIQQGLVPEGEKAGRNMAHYGDGHVDRLKLIKRLQEERMLPLKAIRAVLEGETDTFDGAQRAHLSEVAARSDSSLLDRASPTWVDAREACAARRVPFEDLKRLAELGGVTLRPNPEKPKSMLVPSDALWLIDVWSQLNSIGFTRERGITVDHLAIYDEAVAKLFKTELRVLLDKFMGVSADEIASMLEQALPLIHALIIGLHTAAVRHFLGSFKKK